MSGGDQDNGNLSVLFRITLVKVLLVKVSNHF